MEGKKPRINYSKFFFRCCLLSMGFSSIRCIAQNNNQDTIRNLPAVTVKAYLTEQDPFRITGSISTIDSATFEKNITNDLLPVANGVAGVKMEERSPGSYRLSIRGSLLRSPFGVRNIKIYYDEIPLTDASGNTYLNLLDMDIIQRITFLKGPDGSLFGANSGGVLLIQPNELHRSTSIQFQLNVSSGSFDRFSQQAAIDIAPNPSYRLSINQAYNNHKGYREHSGMSRRFIQTTQRWHYAPPSEIRFIGFYSDLRYQTPGGLTAAQYHLDPKQARPRSGAIPGAAEQQAGIENRTFWGGFVHEHTFWKGFKNVSTIFGSVTDFKNPFISNYETRDEKNLGVRSWFEYANHRSRHWNWNIHLGIEWQQGWASIHNYDNNQGKKGVPQIADKMRIKHHFYFVRWSVDWKDRLLIEASNSLNQYTYAYKHLFPVRIEALMSIRSQPEWMPRLAASYSFTSKLNGRVSVSKGYSPPTLAEIRASNTAINTNLHAEKGWNYETGLRWDNTIITADLALFNFKMGNAIVRQVNEQGAEYFENAGGVDQKGVEVGVTLNLLSKQAGLLQKVILDQATTYSHFRFRHYQPAGADWSGNKVTGIPDIQANSGVTVHLKKRITFYIRHLYSSKTPLNDSNMAYANAYHLFQSKAMVDIPLHGRLQASVWGAADNIGNIKYSLGNDINAYGGRFYNPAPTRNFSFGVRLSLL